MKKLLTIVSLMTCMACSAVSVKFVGGELADVAIFDVEWGSQPGAPFAQDSLGQNIANATEDSGVVSVHVWDLLEWSREFEVDLSAGRSLALADLLNADGITTTPIGTEYGARFRLVANHDIGVPDAGGTLGMLAASLLLLPITVRAAKPRKH